MSTPPRRRVLALAVSLIATGVVAVAHGPAGADSRPVNPSDPATPTTVSTDALPTVQIDGVAWTQQVVGNTVFVGGRFGNARPAGAAPGQNQTPRSNFLAYDITTGALITSIAPTFNAQVRTIAVSPDGTRLYVGGDFTSVNGLRRDRLAAFTLPGMQLIGTFLPPVGYHVYALGVSPNNQTLYVGGNFNSVGSQARNKLAAFRTSDAALLNWAPNAQGGLVSALAVSPDGTQVAVGGRFTSLNGSTNPGRGLASVDATTGALRPWAINSLVRNSGSDAGITFLTTDGDTLYGGGFVFGDGDGNLEGVFAASWSGGTTRWIADCHGDQYSAYPTGGAVYSVGHAHFCGNLGGRPETNPRTYDRAIAFSKATTGTLARNTQSGYFNFEGQPAPSPLLFYPDLDQGTFTGQNQGPWHVTGNSRYVVMGGEFRNVNFSPQQGLVRFAVASIAPNRQGPKVFGGAWVPSAASSFNGTVRLTFAANHDPDNETLSYRVERDGRAIGSFTARSSWFNRPTLTYTDGGATPGSRPTYRIVAVDPFGNEAPSQTVAVTVSTSGARPPYVDTVLRTNGILDHWRLGETGGSFADLAGTRPLTLGGTATRGVAGAIANDADRAVTFGGGSAVSGAALTTASFSVEAWVRTSSTAGGKIVGSQNSGGSTILDRHLYLGNDGRVSFGVNTGSNQVLTSPAAINDNQWRHVVGTYDAGVMRLYVDGVEVASRSGVGTARLYNAVWRVGGGSLAGWNPRPSSDNLAGTVDEVSVYSVAVPAAVVQQHWNTGRGNPADPAIAVDAFGRTVTNGLGTADIGGSWTITGAPANFSVADGLARLTMPAPASSSYALLPASSSRTEVRVSVAFDKLVAGGSGFAAVIGRRVGGDDYRAKVRVLPDGQVQLSLVRTTAGAETTLTTIAVPGVVLTANERLQVRFQVVGTNPTTLRARVWETGAAEPADWQTTITDTTAALQNAGGVGLWVYVSSAATNTPVTATFDDLRAVAI